MIYNIIFDFLFALSTQFPILQMFLYKEFAPTAISVSISDTKDAISSTDTTGVTFGLLSPYLEIIVKPTQAFRIRPQNPGLESSITDPRI